MPPLALAVLLTACGGGGGGSGGTTTPTNRAPVAEAGSGGEINPGDIVRLDGSASRDSDGTVESFAWVQSAGPPAGLVNEDTVTATFRAPNVAAATQLVFTLTVTDDDGAVGSDSVNFTVTPLAPGAAFDLTGRLLPSDSQVLDGDTNDPFNPVFDNSDVNRPQSIGNPATVGGYVNEADSGPEGRSRQEGDREDFYLVELLEGQNVDLLVAEFDEADADLYLYSRDGEVLDFSIETGQRETISIESSGTYIVNVSIFSGATNYTLTIGSSLTPVADTRANVIADQAIVRYTSDAAGSGAERELARRMELRQIGGGPRRARLLTMPATARGTSARRERLGPDAYRRDRFRDPAAARLWETLISIKRLARQPGVASAEPNYRVYPTARVNDEAYGLQWHYPLINLPGAWDTTTGDPGVIVAVIDTGILAGHPDLRGQLVDGYDFVSDPAEAADGDGIDPNPEETIGGSDPDAVNYHGSHVAGTVAARGNNAVGVAGVAFGARLMPLRAITASGGTLFDVNQAVRFAAGLPNDSGTLPARAADIINLSLSGSGFSPSSQSLYNELRRLGIAVVAAAGNEGSSTLAYPASYDNVISVSAVDVQQELTGYSNTGSRIDVAAPGGDGSVDLNGDGYPDGVLSTGASDGAFAYTFLSGTSMAAPHVAGVLALMKSVNPALDADDFDRLLESGELTDDLGPRGRDDRYGHGLINARRAIDAALREAGNAASTPPRLGASTLALNFGAATTRLDVVLRNAGSGSLEDVRLETAEDWISISPVDTDTQGLGRYAVRVDRGALAPGIYQGRLLARSAANDLELRVLLAVADPRRAELGQIYLLLVDAQGDDVVRQSVATRSADGGYGFRFDAVPAGRYLIFAGTDLDNDLLICDAGEACGSYLTIDQPLSLDIDGDRDDLDFPVEYLIALPGAASTDGDGRIGSVQPLQRRP